MSTRSASSPAARARRRPRITGVTRLSTMPIGRPSTTSWRCATSPPENHAPDEFRRLRNHQANGMGGLPMVGDPDSVTAQLARLADAGLTGIAVSFVNYLDELPYFCAEVLPRLARLGLRDPT